MARVVQKEANGRYAEATKREVVRRVTRAMASGKTLEEACRSVGISSGLVRSWVLVNEDFSFMFRTGRYLMSHALFDRAITIAKKTTNKTVGRDRLEVETLRWAVAKLNPEDYGDKVSVDGRQDTTLTVNVVEDSAPIVEPPRRRVPVEVGVVEVAKLPANTRQEEE